MIENLSIEELGKLVSGEDFWHSHAVPEAGIPAITMSDGPHGLRKQEDSADHLGIHDSIKAICFPSAASLASAFDRDAAYLMGRMLGLEARSEGVNIVLGPAMNIKRTPLCGRNFEYFSEDPYLTGEIAAAVVRGIQSAGVGACVKHFAANNQENGRMTISADVDSRALREIYLRAFETVIRSESPRAVMSSYNRINGEYVGESEYLLTDILRKEWGFNGIVISDWYAVNDRVKALTAGLDLEMPGGPIASTDKVIAAAKQSESVKAALKTSAERIARTAKALNCKRSAPYDKEEHHECAVRLAAESAVLLKNNGIFPLNKGEKVLLIGEFAAKPRFQGGGSSHINAYRVDSVVEHLKNADYISDIDETEARLSALEKEIKRHDKIIVFGGLPDEYESEGYDRNNLDLPKSVNELIGLSAKYAKEFGKSLGVVLFHGSPVLMPWLDEADGVLSMGLSGEGAGKACAMLLTGEVNPSGRLQESYPLCIENAPAYTDTKGIRRVRYSEGVFIGYRYYLTKKIDTLFPFGYGLSYTEFEYSRLNVEKRGDNVKVSVNVKNIGRIKGKEAVQLYISPPAESSIDRPVTELRGFEKILLEPGEEKRVEFTLEKRDFCYFDENTGQWRLEGGKYTVIIGRSSKDRTLFSEITIDGDEVRLSIDDNTTIGELLGCKPTAALIRELIKGYSAEPESEAIGSDMKRAMLLNAPLRLVKGIAKLDDNSYRALKDKLKELARL